MTTTAMPQQLTAALQHAQALIAQGALQQAAQALNQIAAAQPRDPRVYLLGGELARASGNLKGVAEAARRAQQLAPVWPVANLFLAESLAALSNYAEAMAYAQRATAADAQPEPTAEILSRAAAIAEKAGDTPTFWRWVRAGLKKEPNNAALQRQLSRALMAMGDGEGAVELLTDLISQHPDVPSLRLDRVRAYLAAEQFDLALQDASALCDAEPDNTVYVFFKALAQQQTPSTQPAALIERVFQDAAVGYDTLMVDNLRYLLPDAVAAQMVTWYPERDADVLDLGCGTGLLGRRLAPWKGAVVGADVSRPMLEQAQRLGGYDKLYAVNLLDALRETPSEHYDVITLLDVLGFAGSLDAVLPGALRILTPGGRLVFTFQEPEPGQEGDLVLDKNLVYRHKLARVQEQVAQAGFVETSVTPFKLRIEQGAPVLAQWVVARKPS
ncbi:MAG: hypothetical protein OHK0048_03850 [Rhodoferax sp.]